MKLRRSTAILLIISAIISCSVCTLQRTVYAAGTGYFYVTGLPANIRSAPGTDKTRLVKLFSPTYLIYTNKTAEVNGAEWYSIRYDDGGKTRDGWILGSLGYLTSEKNEESSAQSGSGKTGIGQAEWAWRAYNEGWDYVWGGSKAGTVDCSGLIRSYVGCGGGAASLLNASSSSGGIGSIPRIHGLAVWKNGHCGIYVGKDADGNDMVIDARNKRVDVKLNRIGYMNWSKWFKIKGVSYPSTGWYRYSYNGKTSTYYYKDGQFVTGKQTIDGITYDFGKNGALKGEPPSGSTPGKSDNKSKITTAKTSAKPDAATQKSANISDKTAASAKTDSGTANDPACDGIEPQDNIGLAQVCVKSASCLNIRCGAGPGYPVSGRLYDGDLVNYLESKTIGGQVWYSVVFKGKAAWICGKPDQNTSYLKILSVPMRSGPAASAKSSTEAVVTGNTQKTGYTDDRKAVGKIRVAVKCLNIRTDSRASADRIGVIYMDSTADYYSIKKEGSETWYQISFRDVSGWVCGRKDTENVYAVIVDRDEAEKTSEAAIDAMTSSAAVYGDTEHTSPSDETIETTLAEDLSR